MALKSLLLDTSVSEQAKARVRESHKVLSQQDNNQMGISKMQRDIRDGKAAEDSAQIGKRTEREQVKDVEMVDESTQKAEKRQKVMEDVFRVEQNPQMP